MDQIESAMSRMPADFFDGKSPSRLHSEWACLVGQNYRLDDRAFRDDALALATQMMARVRDWLKKTVSDLQKENYQFVYPDKILTDPDPAAPDWIGDFRQQGVHISVAFEAWLRVVGGVNLSGPAWPRPAYAYDDDTNPQEPLYTDPLVVEMPQDYMKYLYDEWLEMRDQSNERTPFRIDIAPDHIHKANISGGLPYQLSTERPEVDGIIWNERHGISFVGYLRLAIRWRGFPGFEYLADECTEWLEREKFDSVI